MQNVEIIHIHQFEDEKLFKIFGNLQFDRK